MRRVEQAEYGVWSQNSAVLEYRPESRRRVLWQQELGLFGRQVAVGDVVWSQNSAVLEYRPECTLKPPLELPSGRFLPSDSDDPPLRTARISHPASATTRICHAFAIMMAILPCQNAVGQAESAVSLCSVTLSQERTCSTADFWDHTGSLSAQPLLVRRLNACFCQ